MTKHREYPIALKQAAVARVAAGESIAEVARGLKLRGRLVYAWRDQVRRGGPAALRERGRPRQGATAGAAGAGEGELARAQRRVAELERKIGQQQVDLDFFSASLAACEGDTVSQRRAWRRAVYESHPDDDERLAARPSHDRAPVPIGARQPRRLLPLVAGQRAAPTRYRGARCHPAAGAGQWPLSPRLPVHNPTAAPRRPDRQP